jgi:hypothetical protein
MVVRLLALRAVLPLSVLQNDSWYSFLLEAESIPRPYGWKDYVTILMIGAKRRYETIACQ